MWSEVQTETLHNRLHALVHFCQDICSGMQKAATKASVKPKCIRTSFAVLKKLEK